jgi:predicted dehydrogenase
MRKLRAAVIGVGYLGRFHAQKYAASEECELVAVVDSQPDVAAKVAAEIGAQAFSDYLQLAGRIDVASVATTTPSHFDITAWLLRAGVHVLVEKPITSSVEQARVLIETAAKQGRVLQVGHLERFNPAILAAEPLLGRPRFIECHRLAPFRLRGTDVNVVLDLMIHDIDILQSIVNSEIVSLDAVGAPVFSPEIDIANARLRFANGCVANATASRVSMKTERKLRIFLDDAYLSIDLQQKILTTIRKRTQPADDTGLPVSIEERSFEQGDALRDEIAAFLAACRGERRVAVSGEDGLRALQTAISITEMLTARNA